MGKDYKNKHFRNRNQKPYNKDNWKNQKQHGHQRAAGNRQQTAQTPKVTLRENQVGITEFTSDCPGFTAVFKSRYSDFHVNEIDTNDKVLILDNLTVPQVRDEAVSEEQLSTGRKQLESSLGANVWKQIEELAAAKYEPNKEQRIDVEVTTLDKEQRTEIHKVFKKLFDGKLVSTTVNQTGEGETAGDKKFIRFMKPKNKRDQQRNRWEFPGDYVHFLVHKENLDTGEVAAGLAQRLGMKASQVNYCGTKDKRAKTTQKFCIKKRPPTQIVKAVRFIQNAHIGNFEFSKDVLKLGDLKGNRFRLALRYITSDQSQIEASLVALRERGFINYYGLQRFGNCATVPTYEVGLALLKSDYKLACELILKPRDNDANFLREIRETWWKNRDSAAAAAMFHNNKFIEKKVLDGLAQYGENDYAGALRKIPRNMLLLYTHAYQSLIFNRVASRRIKEYGLKLIPGDLVYRNKQDEDFNEPELPDDLEATEEILNENESDAKADISEKPTNSNENQNENNSVLKTESEQETESIFKRKVKPLTEAEIASGSYTIFDVVLPLPGFDVTYPDNETGLWYKEFLAESDLTSEKLKHNVKTYALMGAYRKLLIQPNGLKWHFRKYVNHEHALIASDWEQLKKIELPKEPDSNEEAFTALILEFSLPTAAYATMLLRELLKLDTSAMHQMQLELTALGKANAVSVKDATETEKLNETSNKFDNATTEKRKITEADDEIDTSSNINKKLKELE